MLTAKSEVEDRITGLNAGADYYDKAFRYEELLACVNALLRRQGPGGRDKIWEHIAGSFYGNAGLRRLVFAFQPGNLILCVSCFRGREGRFFPRGDSCQSMGLRFRCGGKSCGGVYRLLRKKLASIGSDVRIESKRRLGYHLEVSEHGQHDKKAAN